MNEADELIELCVRALVAQMIAAPGVELHVTRTCVLGLTDEPLADFNRLILGAEAVDGATAGAWRNHAACLRSLWRTSQAAAGERSLHCEPPIPP